MSPPTNYSVSFHVLKLRVFFVFFQVFKSVQSKNNLKLIVFFYHMFFYKIKIIDTKLIKTLIWLILAIFIKLVEQ